MPSSFGRVTFHDPGIDLLGASVKLLNDLLCAEIAEFFLEIAVLLTTLLLLLVAFLTNVAVALSRVIS